MVRNGCVSGRLEMNTELERDSIGETERDEGLEEKVFQCLFIKKQKGFLSSCSLGFLSAFFFFGK